MKDLVEVLEKIQGDHPYTVADEMTKAEIELTSDLGWALELARGYADSVDMLHQTITGNVKHALALWVDEQAARWERKANEVERWEAAESYLSRAHAYRDIARGIREGAWQA